jgi:hypothetical protein
MKKSPEIIVLAVALGLLAIGAGIMAYTFPSPEDLTNVKSTTPTGKTPKKIKEEELQASIEPWNSPVLWKAPDNQHRLFISDGILFYPSAYPDGDYLKKLDPLTRTPSGVLISWYQKYGLDFTDSNIDREDSDGDGFSNIVEFKNEALKAADCDGSKSTNPLDPQSHPSFISRLRLQKYDSRPFHIQFRGYQQLNGETYFQIFLKDVPSAQQPRLKKTGEPLGFEGYIVGPFHANIVTKKDSATGLESQVDESTLELDKPEIDFKIVLVYRQEIDSPESTANFVMLMSTEVDKVIKVARSQIFSPPYLSDKKYQLREVKDTGAVIRDTQSNQEITIPKLDPAEWDEVPMAPAAVPPPKLLKPF